MGGKAAIAIDLGGTFIKGGVISQTGEPLHTRDVPTGDLNFEAVCRHLADFVRELKHECPGYKFSGVGIGSPGGIHRDRATISQSPNFPTWKDAPLKASLADLGVEPLVLENDANVAALGENWVGSGRDVEHMAAFTLGTGVGGGVILNRTIWRGAWGMAGELGHITIYPDGPVCGCGNRGCLEALININAIITKAQQALDAGRAQILNRILATSGEALSPKNVYQAAGAGDESCRSIYENVGITLGIAIADVLNVLNLPLFVIGGGMSAVFDLLEPQIVAEVQRRAFRVPGENVRIAKAQLGNLAGLFGAARLVFQEFEP